ncbi:MAG: hypothetical protein ACM3S0_02555 [Acidobacteriota bacterium]
MSSSEPPKQPIGALGWTGDFSGCLQHSVFMIIAALIWLGINVLVPAPKATITPFPTSPLTAPASGAATRAITVPPVTTPLPSPTLRR